MSDAASDSELVEFRDTATMGMGCFATRDIDAGEVVLRDSTQIVWNYQQSKIRKVDFWLRTYEKMDESQRRAWSSLHKVDNPVRATRYADILRFERPEGPFLTEKQQEYFKDLFLIAESNAFMLNPRASVLFVKASRFNHSCDPNVDYRFPSAYCWRGTAKRFIAKGEELFISYMHPHGETASRHEFLQKKWAFTCACPKCVGGVDEYTASLETALQVAQGGEPEKRARRAPTFEGASIDGMQAAVEKRVDLLIELSLLQVQPADERLRVIELVFANWDASAFHSHYFKHFNCASRGNNRIIAATHLQKHRKYIEASWELAKALWGRTDELTNDIVGEFHEALRLGRQYLGRGGFHRNAMLWEAGQRRV